jgi:alpha-1,2-glucosyltransferase
MSAVRPVSGISLAARYAVPFVLLLIPLWMAKVNTVVPDPYLDEVFHVPQAQAYWDHKWFHWDPKITTPPGLYIWSYVLCAAALALRGSPKELNAEALRATNVAAAAVFLPWRLQTLLDALRKVRNTRPSGAWLSHTVLNICLFPPLFFFSGLYYTDIVSLLVVIEAYNWDIKRSAGSGSLLKTAVFVAIGLAALVLRQTNIFWVAIFLGGLKVVRKLRQSSKASQASSPLQVIQSGFNNELYDPLVSEASFLGECLSWPPGQRVLIKMKSRLYQNVNLACLSCSEGRGPSDRLSRSLSRHPCSFRWICDLEQWSCPG